MKVLFTTAARADLAEIRDYIRRDNPVRADSFNEEFIATCEAIADYPYGAPILRRYERQGYRRTVHRGYPIVYRVLTGDVQVVRVLNGARDIDRALRSQER